MKLNVEKSVKLLIMKNDKLKKAKYSIFKSQYKFSLKR